jgi:hypothetical protein
MTSPARTTTGMASTTKAKTTTAALAAAEAEAAGDGVGNAVVGEPTSILRQIKGRVTAQWVWVDLAARVGESPRCGVVVVGALEKDRRVSRLPSG